MIGQLQKNFRMSISIGAICSLLYAPYIYADDISGNQISASTDLPIWSGFEVQQIADGIEPSPSGDNGFTTNAKTGIITLDFDQPYNIDGFKLWNDVVISAEGIKTFQLNFKTASGGTLSSQVFEARPAKADAQIFNFPEVSDVISVDLVILSSSNVPATVFHRIEVREVAFTGVASNTGISVDNTATQIAAMEDYIAGLQDIIKGHEAHKRTLESNLEKEKRRAGSTFKLLEQRDETIAVLSTNPTATTTLTLLGEQKEEGADLKAEISKLSGDKRNSSLLQILFGGLSLLTLGGIVGYLMRRKTTLKPKSAPHQIKKLKPEDTNSEIASYPIYIIEAKDSLPNNNTFDITPALKRYPQDMRDYDKGNNALPIEITKGLIVSGSSKLVAGQSNISTNVLGIKQAYNAVGRVGLAQDGPAIGADPSYGTAILIAKDRVITNRHVLDSTYKRIADETDPFGIEFFGEKDSDATEFYELTLDEAVIIEEYDAAILKLKKAVPENLRQPIAFTNKLPEEWDNEDIYVIGYPADPAGYTDEIRAVIGEDLVFGVKRYSSGNIFRHPQDTDDIYGIETIVNGERYSEKGWLHAICHQASTLPGNSGSAVISQKSGELLGLHFGADNFDRHETLEEYPANVAHEGRFLSHCVTYITSEAFKNFLRQNR